MAKPKKPPYAKGRAACIYCGTFEDMSEEHIWADWLKAYIPRVMSRHRYVSAVVHSDPTKNTAKVTKREGDPYVRKLKIACRPCNNGWMSQLQTNAKPYLTPTLLGEKASFYKNGQTALATWITMFVMTADFLDTNAVSITAEERSWFKAHQRPPVDWRIWIGRYEKPESARRWIHCVLDIVEDEAERLAGGTPTIQHAQTSTILLGNHLIIHVMSSPAMRQTIERWELLPAAAPAMTQIWPIIRRRIDWPGPVAIQGAAIEQLAFHFIRRMDTVARQFERGS